ncbi:hypothetical protein Acor_70340 [Acrocarpospora corrugata]|uniref:Inosine/uridine-preferring nucleoside hydrolase domain-containing protein n=1 Tax=Acrocarpospora corrugata TaxID=35763 RepID=A0A5M3W822_9ACTN|nr:hypothetical protein [Acrocarpospora corrugata]GES04966.1 hypothetical protein Acor_70340 [Acrocarpospora corrugata]
MKRILPLLLAGTLTACAPATHPPEARKIIVDTDMGHLNDDALATLLVAGSGAEILGVTIVGGQHLAGGRPGTHPPPARHPPGHSGHSWRYHYT